jgi:hypothetical protein
MRRARLKFAAAMVAGIAIIGLPAAQIVFHSRAAIPAAAPKPILVSAVVPAQAPPRADAPKLASPSMPAEKMLLLKVAEGGTRAPLAGVSVNVRLGRIGAPSKNWKLETGENGSIEFMYPTDAGSGFMYRFELSKDGYVPRYVSWSAFQKDEITDIPSEYTATIDRGIEIGGFVHDPSGQPIEGVKVVFNGPSPVGVPPRERDTTMGSYHTETTDASGHWHCNHVRPEFQSITYFLNHPRFRFAMYGCTGTDEPSANVPLLPKADFLAGKADMKMEPGLTVSGIVVDPAGAPIPGAQVTENRDWSRKEATISVGNDGRFAFHDAVPGGFVVTAQASGRAPATVNLELSAEPAQSENLRLVLAQSLGLRGRIVSEYGDALPGTEVELTQDSHYQTPYKWSTRADEFGDFHWDSSPNEDVSLQIYAYGFHRTNVTVHPGNDLQIIVLSRDVERRIIKIPLRVIDAETKKPLDGAEIYAGEWHASGGVPLHPIGKTKAGEFIFKLDNPESSYQVEVQLAGYLPVRSARFHTVDAPKNLEFALTKGVPISGTIISPGGTPVPNAEIAICTDEKGAILGQRQFLFTDQAIIVHSDEKGYFMHPAILGAHALCVVHESGFAWLELKNSETGGPIQLQPWGRIAGRITVNGEIAKNAEIGLYRLPQNGNQRGLTIYDFATRSDQNGNFTFENVPPIEVNVAWMLPSPGGKSYSHAAPVLVEPGKTTEFAFDIIGRTLRGRFTHAFEIPTNSTTWASLETKRIPVAKNGAFSQSREGRALQRRQQSFAVQIHDGGSFEIPAVPPGDYLLHLDIREKTKEGLPTNHLIGLCARNVAVPPGGGDLDLGEIAIVQNQAPAVNSAQ